MEFWQILVMLVASLGWIWVLGYAAQVDIKLHRWRRRRAERKRLYKRR